MTGKLPCHAKTGGRASMWLARTQLDFISSKQTTSLRRWCNACAILHCDGSLGGGPYSIVMSQTGRNLENPMRDECIAAGCKNMVQDDWCKVCEGRPCQCGIGDSRAKETGYFSCVACSRCVAKELAAQSSRVAFNQQPSGRVLLIDA